ncbi:hypothetical protein MKW98_027670 [Papaver atlanticum]|uniref:Peroxidase n=1 Tax=Papaver atlanticum TaxID=357466 RepID=A0AAD4XIP9_9MAGN|nr:hypothetical protein MKW98_027670 [Papaver atlanticum]
MKNFGVAVFLLVLVNLTNCYGILQTGFYVGKCGNQDVEAIIRNVVRQRFARDPTIVAALLRMHFHDCFVTGCDASLLLDGPSSEKTANPNFSVRGYDLIDEAKAAVERACPRVVSCADIIAICTRDAVSLAQGINYRVRTGRRDGLVSQASSVDLPGPTISVDASIAFFADKGFTTKEMVVLIGGGHTVGVTHCAFIRDRLFDFRNTGRPDPSMNANLLNRLRGTCPRGSPDNTINLDQTPGSSFVVDNGFYNQLGAGNGVLEIDQAMASHPETRNKVRLFANDGPLFQTQFATALIKMGNLDVITHRNGKVGEIRRNCRARN